MTAWACKDKLNCRDLLGERSFCIPDIYSTTLSTKQPSLLYRAYLLAPQQLSTVELILAPRVTSKIIHCYKKNA